MVILVPMPRYVRSPCCGDDGHVTNQGEKDFYEEFLGAEKRLLGAAAAGDRTREVRLRPPFRTNDAGRDISVGRRWSSPDLASIQSGGETPGRRVRAVRAGRGGRARNKEAKAGECCPITGTGAGQAGIQGATADAEAGRPSAVAVRTASRNP